MRWLRPLAVAAVLSLGAAARVCALDPEEQLGDPGLEARARAISRELRCVVCQSQTIDDSTAPVAQALRKLVRDRLKAGDDDRRVIAAVTARYGDFVLLKPRFSSETAALWIGPFLALGLAGAAGYRYVRAHAAAAPEVQPLTEQERLQISAVLDEDRLATDDGQG